MIKSPMAHYKRDTVGDCDRYSFFCDISGALAFTTRESYTGETEESAALIAWEKEGKANMNYCRKCARWVIDAMFNVEVLECVECAPYECEPNFCKNCGAKVTAPAGKCSQCGSVLRYEGRNELYDSESEI